MLTFSGTPKMPRGCSDAPRSQQIGSQAGMLLARGTGLQEVADCCQRSQSTIHTQAVVDWGFRRTRDSPRPCQPRRAETRSSIHFSTLSDTDIPLVSSFLVEFRLKFLHHEAKSRFEGGELEGTGSGEVSGNWTGSRPGCDFPVTMVFRGTQRRVEDGEEKALRERCG